ncbi:MAG: beta-glucosidase BglX [Sphingomonadales bacterium]|nr:beta-glucosidase BglX [Sphingomonadales bacterium]
MFSFQRFSLFLFCSFLSLSSLFAQSSPADSIEIAIDRLMAKMTLEEKIGQMNQYNGFWDVTGPAPKAGADKFKYDHFKQGLVGSVLNVRGVKQVRALQEMVVKESGLGIPLLFGFDAVHGYNTVLPIPLAEAASWDLPAIERSARVTATEAAASGINWTFAPMVDISRDARWGRVMEGAGEDPYLGSQIAMARVKGFQGNDFRSPFNILATAKHFAGYGFAEGGRDYNTVDVSPLTLHNIILPPFKASVQQGVASVMNSFNIINGVPATANRYLVQDILKRDWKFKGVVVSDWGSGVEMIDHGYAENLSQVAALSANAGSDVDMESYAYVNHLKNQVTNGNVSVAVIDQSVRRVLRLKFLLGLFNDPYKYCDSTREQVYAMHPEHASVARDMARRSMVLLKNDQDLLPLKPAGKKIAVIGSLAADKNSPLGNWRLAAKDSSAVSLVEALDAAGVSYTYAPGVQLVAGGPVHFVQELPINENDTTGMAQAISVAKDADVVIMMLGEHGLQSGEGRSRAQLNLPGLQQSLLEAVHKVNPRIVLVLMSGRPLAISWAAAHVPGILLAWQPGSQSGHAIVDVLLGKYNPAGKLPMTFPRSDRQLPIYYNQFSTGRPGPKKEVFWSHYIDEAHTPLYEFGYGKSYTQFSYSDLQITPSKDSVSITVTLTNTGSLKGEEVAQLYIHDRVSSVVRPVRELKGFKKLLLEPGARTSIRFDLPRSAFGYFDAQGKWFLEPGLFDIYVGGSSFASLTGAVQL